MKTTGHTIVIAGGSGGIGLALARAFVSRGNRVLAVGRSEEKLARAKTELPQLETLACDIADETSARRAMERICSEHPDFDVLVNAAGTSRACRFADDDGAIALARAEIDTNLFGTVMFTKLALAHLLAKKESAVITISSGIALAPHLAEPTHSATKAALHAFTLCLRAQLAGTTVKVFEVLPPLTDTPLTKQYGAKKARPSDVAEAIVKGFANDTFEIRIGIVKALGVLVRLSPALAARVVSGTGR